MDQGEEKKTRKRKTRKRPKKKSNFKKRKWPSEKEKGKRGRRREMARSRGFLFLSGALNHKSYANRGEERGLR